MYNPQRSYQEEVHAMGQVGSAEINGEFCSLYRMTASSAVSILRQRPLYNAFPIQFKRTTSRQKIENAMFEILVFDGICDPDSLMVGDIVVDNRTGERYCFGQYRSLTRPLFVRVDATATIGMPFNPASNRGVRAPRVGAQFVPAYGVAQRGSVLPVTLAAGAYSIGAAGDTAAQIPIGVQMKNNLGAPHDADLTDALLKSNYTLYIPPIPGVPIIENMVLSLDTGISFVLLAASTNIEGMVGTIAIGQKVAV